MTRSDKHENLKNLPGIDHLLELSKKNKSFLDIPRSVILESARTALEIIRKNILANIETPINDDTILMQMHVLAKEKIRPRLVNVINATGVVLHTNLGRALLCDDALKNITRIAQSYS
ncbi:MAG TPA: L-seryl-tRNA(Sec) selenium transferase, partial [Desulfobacterales bacterium]|nr:L-seryl-tRNA(Sec) selenium transferase [Desulfobacterales bacterium]